MSLIKDATVLELYEGNALKRMLKEGFGEGRLWSFELGWTSLLIHPCKIPNRLYLKATR